MSGHSKWATTKRHKGAIDAKRGKIFSNLAKEITLAARAGGGDPNANVRLRSVLLRARAANMPSDNIDRAIKKGTGELPGLVYEEMLYEGYAVGGVGLIVEVTTDNKNRAIGEIRSTFTKNGGNLANSGALTSFFQRKGQIIISAEVIGEDELMEIALEAGAEDIKNNGDFYEVITAVSDYDSVAKALEDKQIKSESSDLVYLPNVEVPISDAETAKKIQKLIDALEDLDDVKAVHSNDDIADGLLD
ncbi:MAG: YebC/PmpR family DNA-binding transcriptional regulator [Verrucomicrobia bacterium]|nr:YebC/PmpR family DNA-binding transcriptional regulator [Verrucomicrobiota bacterium]MBR6798040.1 YebC/PmpR family DNA-binding transcriptional regulator [Opitutales bacterium]